VIDFHRSIQLLDNTQVLTASFVGSKERMLVITDSGNLLPTTSSSRGSRALFFVEPPSMLITISFLAATVDKELC